MTTRVGVIGGGPAGIMAAGAAAGRGHDVTLIEKNKQLGKKLFITGKGRCNITNASPISEFFDNIISNREFLYSSLYTFDNEAIIRLLESYGLNTKVERGNRVFPESDKSSDVIKAFQKYLDHMGAEVLLNSRVSHVYMEDNIFMVVLTTGEKMQFDRLVIATGGASYPATGSEGDGYKMARAFGHTVTELKPSLVPIELEEPWLKDLMGLSLKNVTLRAYSDKKLIHEEFGEMIFTHFGISGPIVLTMSNHINRLKNKPVLTLDLKPALDDETLDNRLLRDFQEYKNKQLKNALNDLLPQKLIPLIIQVSGIYPEKTVHQITREERSKLLEAIKAFPLQFKVFRPLDEAIVTSGGIKVQEVNPSTMESRIVPGLYFAGEIIDIDALTGGYNLQIAYSTGYLAGINV
ncbi:NAD(P)/FAD-dependent oxidoreductase [Gudongella oleilytica]|uniref:NAD(P)/FAD-dependent oxidoreductase n=1 Tax=Gudongella oleilytica TaxID=1582259 RepID=UPI002A362239|nr:NAD(P)/FAD-dependent oxidoreductase [Gudongella oleilytica]MDY0255769.1 NAD(P)/FAD-dependent oxidoreductase [Gudongella oleilytica]